MNFNEFLFPNQQRILGNFLKIIKWHLLRRIRCYTIHIINVIRPKNCESINFTSVKSVLYWLSIFDIYFGHLRFICASSRDISYNSNFSYRPKSFARCNVSLTTVLRRIYVIICALKCSSDGGQFIAYRLFFSTWNVKGIRFIMYTRERQKQGGNKMSIESKCDVEPRVGRATL